MNAQSVSRRTIPDVRPYAAAIAAVLLGGYLNLVVGFSPIEAVHNAAHDARHSAGFPCH